MPHTSTNFLTCPYPFSCDVYSGCSHLCKYCFANRTSSHFRHGRFQNVGAGESFRAVENFVNGRRTKRDSWCDWDCPIRFGANSDPFQPCERKEGRMMAVLRLMARKGYPFIVTTKGTDVISSPEYIAVLKDCNVCVQVSMSSPRMDALEPGAPPYESRLRAVDALSGVVPRVVARMQPFLLEHAQFAAREVQRISSAGAYGVILDLLYPTRHRLSPKMIRNGARWMYAAEDAERPLRTIRDACHQSGMKFYPTLIRKLADGILCCTCGEMDGFIPNRCNALQYNLGRAEYHATDRQCEKGTGDVFNIVKLDRANVTDRRHKSFLELMEWAARNGVSKDSLLNS